MSRLPMVNEDERMEPHLILGVFPSQLVVVGNDMLWLFITAAGTGALLGLALWRVLAVFAASLALAVTTVILLSLAHWGLLGTIVYTLMLLGTLQCSYVIGFISSSRWTRNSLTECSRLHRSG